MCGIELPVQAMEHMYFLTEEIDGIDEWLTESGGHGRGVLDFGGEIYLRAEGRSLLLGTYEQACVPWQTRSTPWDFGSQLLTPDLERLAPSLEVGFAHFPIYAEVGIKQVVNGPWGDKMYFYLPEPVKKHLAACGFLVGSGESVYLSGRGFVTARPVNFEFEAEEGETPTSIIRLPYSGTEPEIWRLGEHDTFYALDHEAEVVGYQGGYVLVKVTEPGEYIAVARGAGGGNDLLYDLWGAFAN